MHGSLSDRFERLQIGKSVSMLRTVMETNVNACARISGDANPIHMCESFAIGKGFTGRVAHGIFTVSMISALIGKKLPGPATIFIRQSLNYLNPVQIGDVVFARVEIADPIRDRRRARLRYDCWVDVDRCLQETQS
jgi:3-hydroxybutyryl-CoA dehydratase